MYAITQFQKSTNGILVGPTLLEGLNFDGDKCRFSICMKLPYPNLSNNLVAAKKDLIPNWYASACIASLEQGFGRGVRFDGDWCVNYILDGCIANLIRFNGDLFSRNTQNRLKALG
jgi:Rad3-related DNA helicase